MGLTLERNKTITQEGAKRETVGKETIKQGAAKQQAAKQDLSVELFAMKSDESGLFDDMFPAKQDELLKGLVYSIILAKPRCRQRGGSPWQSRY